VQYPDCGIIYLQSLQNFIKVILLCIRLLHLPGLTILVCRNLFEHVAVARCRWMQRTLVATCVTYTSGCKDHFRFSNGIGAEPYMFTGRTPFQVPAVAN
jgi:hypothetical protein